MATYPTQFTTEQISYLSFNMVAFLINNNLLGLTENPNPDQLAARNALTMLTASAQELAVTNGYRRAIITPTVDGNEMALSASFTASGGSIGPFTHIVFARGASLAGANNANGNNRGNSTGSLIFIESVPVSGTARTIATGVTYTFTKTINVLTGAV